MHFRILKMIATSGFLTALEGTKFIIGRGSTPGSDEELTLRPLNSFKGVLLLRKGRE